MSAEMHATASTSAGRPSNLISPLSPHTMPLPTTAGAGPGPGAQSPNSMVLRTTRRPVRSTRSYTPNVSGFVGQGGCAGAVDGAGGLVPASVCALDRRLWRAVGVDLLLWGCGGRAR